MVFHMGINPYNGNISYCNESEKETVDLNFDPINNNKIEKVSLMFKQIKTKINGDFGCLCICLNNYYGNEIRKKFVEEGFKNGFKNVEIINWETSLYLYAISQSKYKPLNGDVIWTKWSGFVYGWKINDKKAEFAGDKRIDLSKPYELQNIISEKGPDIILYHRQSDETSLRKFSSTCQLILINFLFPFVHLKKGSLMQARITSGDPDLIHLDTEKFLSKNIAIRIGDKEITSFKRGQKLPIIITKILKKEKNDDVLEIKSYNSDFVKVPDQEALTLTFQINLDEIYFVKFSPSYVICVNKNNVIIYNEETQSLTRFPASIDYESDHSKIGVNYRGETVINDVIKNFGKLSCDSVIPIRQYSSPKEIKRYYILKFGKNEHLIDEEKVIVDLFEEAIKQSGISKKYITLTIPSHFSDSQKFAYLKAAEVAGFTDVNSVDEQIALAFGYEKEYDIAENIEYLLINFCDTLIKITLNKAGDLNKENCRRKIIDCENLVSSKLSFFDKIIIDAAGENKPQNENNNFELSLQNFIDAVNELITNVPDLTSIVITWNHFYYVFLQDHFPTFQITFIQNPEELIVKGAAMA